MADPAQNESPTAATPAATCPVSMSDEKPCGRTSLAAVLNGIPYCLMHTPTDKDGTDFEAEFERTLDKAGTGVADFTRCVFPSANYEERQFRARCVFSGATFMHDANFRGATFEQDAIFGDATFKQDTCFIDAKFTEVANFMGATFEQDAAFTSGKFKQAAYFDGAKFKEAYFGGARFKKNAGFNGAKFTEKAHFDRANFTQEADFKHATFTCDADFSETTFTQGIDFRDTTFTLDADFSRATFTQDINFIWATFTQHANFNKAKFPREASFSKAKFLGTAEFRETAFRGASELREIDLRQNQELLPGPVFCLTEFARPEAVVFYKVYLGQALFHNCDVSKLNFSSVEWRRRKNGKGMAFEEVVSLDDYYAADLKGKNGNSDERDYGLIAELYQQLKKNYDEHKDYWTAGDFHYGEMEMKRLHSQRKNPLTRWLHRHLGLVAWYKYFSQYGESYVRPCTALLIVVAVFTLLFPLAGLEINENPLQSAASMRQQTPPAIATSELSYKRFAEFVRTRPGRKWVAPAAFFGHSLMTTLSVAGFQKELRYEPSYPWGAALALLELLLTSTLIALFLLALRRQFRR